MRVGIVQHVGVETAGFYGEALAEAGVEQVTVVLADDPRLPDWHTLDGIVVLGGPMGATDDDQFPWLRAERAWIRAAVGGGRAFLGVCLGAQLLALALGGRVMAGKTPEVGVAPVTFTAQAREDPLFGALPDTLAALHWHADTFSLPPGAVLLAGSTRYPHQVFRWGPAAWGIQCHFEAGADQARAWTQLAPYAALLRRARGPKAEAALLAEIAREEAGWRRMAALLVRRWLSVVTAGRGAPAVPDPPAAAE